MSTLSRDEILRYSRHLLMPEVTLAGQERLKAARVLCVGAGGLGSPLALYLAAAGVGTIGLVDFDRVDLSNLQRQVLYDTRDIGRPKLEAASERLRALNPGVQVVTHALQLRGDNIMSLIGDYDIVADGSDNFPTRYLVSDACVLAGKPDVHASIYRFEGQLSVFAARHGPCYRCLFPEPPPPGLVPSCADGGVLGVLPGIMGSLQALEVIKLILGIGQPMVGRLGLFDALAFELRELALPRDPGCAACGEHPTVEAPIDYEAFCGLGDGGQAERGRLPVVSVEELAARQAAGTAPELLDVREAHERAIAAIPGARPLPLSELPARLHELDSARRYAIACHQGLRSIEAYYLLHKAGFRHLWVVEGGVDAWAERIDPRLPRY
ncbi:MAG: molybdopterin-synthase adenylyltransferase MoeB [Gammaproteobacteria bacterium]|nr:molybdopterin-synthase adenylyltransferase MoeB [Gammaproteobacteria bacterium]